MKPAWSVILFTVVAGLGYGVMTILGILVAIEPLTPVSGREVAVAGGVALVTVTFGLFCSAFHLANPRNAWRAFSRFRTSWLSREGVLAILCYPVFLAFLAMAWNGPPVTGLTRALAVLSALMALITVFATGMIYACLKTIRQWNTALTPLNYVLMSLSLGAIAMTAIRVLAGRPAASVAAAAIGLAAIAGLGKLAYFHWLGRPGGSTINTATGMTRAGVHLFDVGNSAGTFHTREFGFSVTPATTLVLRALVVGLAFVAPTVILFAAHRGAVEPWTVFAALLLAFAGVIVERWLFFAEARHVVNLYHGAQRT